MAYTANTLSRHDGGPIEGIFNIWSYVTADSVASVSVAGYFSDGSARGMKVEDIVWVISPPAVVVNIKTSVATASGSTLSFAAGSLSLSVASGHTVQDTSQPGITFGTTVTSATSSALVLSAAVVGTGVGAGDNILIMSAPAAAFCQVTEVAVLTSAGLTQYTGPASVTQVTL